MRFIEGRISSGLAEACRVKVAGEKTQDGRKEKGDRRRRAIVAAARHLFVAQGFRNTTIESVVARAGGSREMIYRTFRDKNGLFKAIITEINRELSTDLFGAEGSEKVPHEFLADFALKLLAFWESAEGVALNKILLSEAGESPDLMRAWYAAGPQPWIEALTDYFAKQNGLGHLCVPEPPVTARHFMFLLMGESMFSGISGQPSAPISQIIDRSVAIVLNAYADDRRFRHRPAAGSQAS